MMKYTKILLLAAAVFAVGCKSTSVDPVTYTQAISLTVKNLPPNRAGETYALWFGFPGGVAHAKQNDPQHSGTTKYKLVSRFTVDSYGKMTGFDTVGVAARIGYPYALAEQADISVESADTITDTLPSARLLVHDFSGTEHQGIAALVVDDAEALAYSFSSLLGSYTLTPSVGAGSGTDIYLMKATDPSTVSTSLANLPPLEEPWQYALWVVDTSSTNPQKYFYGTFGTASGADSHPAGDQFNYPGGRMPADTTMPALDLRSGTMNVYVTLEPGTSGANPSAPFGMRLLSGAIGQSQGLFAPATLTNTTVLPTATVIINR